MSTDVISYTLPIFVAVTRNASCPDAYYNTQFYGNVTYRSTFIATKSSYTSPPIKNSTVNTSNATPMQHSTAEAKPKKDLKTHVAFLKVHKAGSTTLQNLFFRFGLRHNLNILLPKSGNYIHSPRQIIPLKPGEHYDIFAIHTVYQTKWFKSLVPADSVYIAIVREPLERMISAAYFFRDIIGYNYLKHIPRANFIHNLVNFPEKYNSAFFSRTRNSMGCNFGFPDNIQWSEKDLIRAYLEKLNSEFLLVMTMEKFDESLVMMKRLLKWSFLDIVYQKTNSHKHIPVILNATEKERFRNTSFLDYEIFDYFTEVFETKLKTVGSDFYDEVKFFRDVLDRAAVFCSSKFENKTSVSFSSSKWDEQFEVTHKECEWMNTKEMPFII